MVLNSGRKRLSSKRRSSLKFSSLPPSTNLFIFELNGRKGAKFIFDRLRILTQPSFWALWEPKV
jgi:hypothetical protein